MSLDVIAIILFLGTMLERVLELVISKRNAAWSFSNGGVEYGADHYKWMVLMHTCFLISMLLEFFFFGSQLPVEIQVFAMVIAIFCQVLRWWIISTLGYQWNTRVIIVPGLKRVVKGPYRFMNHPNYVVVALETVALPMIFGAWRTACLFSVLNALMMVVRIRVENKALQELA